MAFFGPGGTLNTKPRWRQGWWLKEKLPGIVTVVVLVVLAGLAAAVGWMSVGFTDDDSGSAPPPNDTASTRTAPATPSGPARPTEKPPELPEVASKPSIAGIEATIRFEIEALNYAQRTGEFEPLKSVYNMVDCKACKLQVERLSTVYRLAGSRE